MREFISKTLLKAFDILFLYNVRGTSYGFIVGMVLLSFQDLAAVYFPNIALIKGYGIVFSGVLAFNIKPIIKKEYEDIYIEKNLSTQEK